VEEELAGFFWRGRSCNGDLDEGKEIWRRDGEEEERKEREGSVQLYGEEEREKGRERAAGDGRTVGPTRFWRNLLRSGLGGFSFLFWNVFVRRGWEEGNFPFLARWLAGTNEPTFAR
jgi:hypothetical protein